MLERALGYADAVLEDLGGQVGEVAGELRLVLGVLSASDELDAVMGDSHVPVPVRRAVMGQLLDGKVSPAAVQLAGFTVQSGPTAGYRHDLSAVAAAAEACRDGLVRADSGPLGRTAAAERAEGYATAVLAGADEHHLGEIEDELFRFMRTVEAGPALQPALTTAEVPSGVRRAVVHELLDTRASSEAARLAAYPTTTGRPRDYLVLLDGLVQRVAAEAGRRVADVRSAAEMNEDQRRQLAAALGRLVGYQVDVRVTTEPDLIGGFVASVGDLVVDASLRHRLRQAAELLTALPSGGLAPAPDGPDEN